MARKNTKQQGISRDGLIYIGRDLDEHLRLSGLKQCEIADLMGIEPSALSRSLRQVESMKLGNYVRLLRAIGFQPFVFLAHQEQITDVFLRELQQAHSGSFIEMQSMNVFLSQVLHLRLSVLCL